MSASRATPGASTDMTTNAARGGRSRIGDGLDCLLSARPAGVPAVLLVLFAVFAVNFVLNIVSGRDPSFDDAEQLRHMGEWAWGYSGVQPPLHTWLVKLARLATSSDLAAIYLARFCVLTALMSALYAAARLIGADRPTAAAAPLGAFLMPQIGWEAQRAFSHSLSVLLGVALMAAAVLAIRRRSGWVAYVALGGAIAYALLGKYNAAIPIACALIAGMAIGEFRRRFTLAGLALSAGVAALLLVRPALWLAGRPATLDDSADKFGFASGGGFLFDAAQGLAAYLVALVGYVGPLVAAAVVGLWAARRARPATTGRPPTPRAGPDERFLWWTMALGLLVWLVGVLASRATEIEIYWLHPVLVLAPVPLAVAAGRLDPSGRTVRVIAGAGLFVAFLTVVVFAYRATGL